MLSYDLCASFIAPYDMKLQCHHNEYQYTVPAYNIVSSIQPTDDSPLICYYCEQYGKIIPDYPQNEALDKEYNDLTPRCYFHSQYTCSTCQKPRHFNGISWCSGCQRFNCVHCSTHRINKKNFMYYDYHYAIVCGACNTISSTLDFAEYDMSHPMQTGEFQPTQPVNVWVPFTVPEPDLDIIGSISGTSRLVDMAIPVIFEKLDNLETHNSQTIWDELADKWVVDYPEDGDYHHKYLIIPELLRLIEFEEQLSNSKSILDIGCGSGNVSRKFARAGYEVTAIDVSPKMLSYAQQQEDREALGITYINMDAVQLGAKFDDRSFDQAYANMSLMNMDGYDKVISQLASVLKSGGLFVFSISHPAFAWPISRSIKLPNDSERNEDKVRMVDNYFDDRPTVMHWNSMGMVLLNFPRMISTYINTLVANGFELLEVSEPEVSEEVMMQHPRNAYNDHNRTPIFMLFKAQKK